MLSYAEEIRLRSRNTGHQGRAVVDLVALAGGITPLREAGKRWREGIAQCNFVRQRKSQF
ncbi:MAG: hypothetical protein DMF06_02875 [Verrucomicrobia bacterium]|nr:MAG: hypothetical protein DMF06_02875 [Verrucomicrobiota bacterium]